eukprot:ANDGO_03563.mRNA.1 BEACH domain-containing protein lvsF
MLQSIWTKQRFSPLLLEDNEYYFDDYIAIYRPPVLAADSFPERGMQGRIRVCSRSLVFDPDDVRFPVFRLPFRYFQAASAGVWAEEVPRSRMKQFQIICSRSVRCREHSRDYPYKTVDYNSAGSSSKVHVFELLYVTTTDVVPMVNSLLKTYGGRDEAPLEKLISNRESSLLFDATWLEDPIREAVRVDLTCRWITPAADVPGRLCVTNERVYFQPFNHSTGVTVHSWDRSLLRVVLKRRHSLRHTALELFFSPSAHNSDKSGGALSMLLVFADGKVRDRVASEFNALVVDPRAPSSTLLNRITDRWVRGELSNFDYLLFLNLMGGRTFADLAQYPVFPWVLRDYSSAKLDLANPAIFRDLSKPMGALNPARLQPLLERFDLMQHTYDKNPQNSQTPFLYGTHYSTPAYVMYFCVRAFPAVLLHLQSGRFDSPDRMFHSVAETFEAVINNPGADVKELIPEFYIPSVAEKFLTNQLGLQMGVKQNGVPLGDVVLPPWSEGSRVAKNFAKQQRSALECDFVSSKLHQWIDLIFGYKQTGEAAKEAFNVFHPLTYEDRIAAVDDAAGMDPVERAAMETQVREFGQCPQKLFNRAHPQRLKTKPVSWSEVDEPLAILDIIMAELSGSSSTSNSSSSTATGSSSGYSSSSNLGSSTAFGSSSGYASGPSSSGYGLTPSSSSFGSGGGGGLNRNSGSYVPGWSSGANTPTASGNTIAAFSSPASQTSSNLTSSVASARSTSPSAGTATPSMVTPSSGNSLAKCGWSTLPRPGRFLVRVHRDIVTDVRVSPNGPSNSVYTTSRDGSLRIVDRSQGSEGRQIRAVTQWTSASVGASPSLSSARGILSSLAVSQDASKIHVASWDGRVYVYAPDYGRIQTTIQAHDDAVASISLVSKDSRLFSASWDGSLRLWDLQTSKLLAEMHDHDAAIHAMDTFAHGPTKVDDSLAVVACADGTVHVWDIRSARSPSISLDTQYSSNSSEEIGWCLSCDPGIDGFGIWIASRDSSWARQYDLRYSSTKSGRLVQECVLPNGANVSTLRAIGESAVVLIGGSDGRLNVWNGQSGQWLPANSQSGPGSGSGSRARGSASLDDGDEHQGSGVSISAIDWNMNSRVLVTAGDDGSVREWTIQDS